ncbi:hypothetical protein M885DRAFT_566539 [Pelagophyceae sp. CCMP2097]|nr:hypothetical protein M885DRAFT_566539 [Pelagophyceae sp. CCMP2097]
MALQRPRARCALVALWAAAASALLCAPPKAAPRLAQQIVVCGRKGALATSGRQRDESRRQARVAQQVRTQLATIIRHSFQVNPEVLAATSILDVYVSPDLRSATATVTTRGDMSDKREAYAWLVRNEKPIRYALAKKFDHSKRCPAVGRGVSFRKADVSAATALMSFIDGVVERDGAIDDGPRGMIDGLDFDDEDDDDDDDDGDLNFDMDDEDDEGDDDADWEAVFREETTHEETKPAA